MNDGEKATVALLKDLGYEVYRSGWPDFLAVKGNRIVGVEHKSFSYELRPNQIAMQLALKPVLPVVVIRTSSSGFYYAMDAVGRRQLVTDFDPFDRT